LFWFFNFSVYFDLCNFNCSLFFIVYCLVFSVCVGSLGLSILVSVRAVLTWVLTFVCEKAIDQGCMPGSVALYDHEEDTLGLYKYVNCEQWSRECYS
jgi:hypothetical protein